MCTELRLATIDLEETGNIQAMMPIITKFETSGFPDNDGAQKAALAAVTEVVDSQFKKVHDIYSSTLCINRRVIE